MITIKSGNFTIQDSTTTSKQAKFSISGITSGQTRTYTLPNISNLVGTGLAQTFTQNMTFNNGLVSYGNGISCQQGGISLGDRTDNSSGSNVEIDNTATNDFPQIELINSSLVSIKGNYFRNRNFIILFFLLTLRSVFFFTFLGKNTFLIKIRT
jgi:hypothetical protein